MNTSYRILIQIVTVWVYTAASVSVLRPDLDKDEAANDVAEIIAAKGYLPNENVLANKDTGLNAGQDANYILSKLSDTEIIRLLNKQPQKKEYNLNDIVNIAVDNIPEGVSKTSPKKRFRTEKNPNSPQGAFFKLENKEVDAYKVKTDADPNYAALQKINNILYSRPVHPDFVERNDNDDDDRREVLFDTLVAQLKALCCKGKTSKMRTDYSNKKSPLAGEQLFLILNDEIASNVDNDLVSVDPDSLNPNSTVLLLGPIKDPLTDGELKVVMNRISNELSKPEYINILQQLSEGTVSAENVRLLKSTVTGSNTRRYMKPHRCNHQSKLARVYGGPKWLICTGYINLNGPSIYD